MKDITVRELMESYLNVVADEIGVPEVEVTGVTEGTIICPGINNGRSINWRLEGGVIRTEFVGA